MKKELKINNIEWGFVTGGHNGGTGGLNPQSLSIRSPRVSETDRSETGTSRGYCMNERLRISCQVNYSEMLEVRWSRRS